VWFSADLGLRNPVPRIVFWIPNKRGKTGRGRNRKRQRKGRRPRRALGDNEGWNQTRSSGTQRIVSQDSAVGVAAKKKGHIFNKIGSTLGNLAGSAIGKIFGMGAYEVSPPIVANSLLGASPSVPDMHTSSQGGIRVTHKEFLVDLITGTDANPHYNAFVLNPGDGRTFPWLASIAANFQQYKLLGVAFEYKSTSGNAVASTNSALGTFSFATHYDVLEGNFQSKQLILNHFYSSGGKTSGNILHFIECEPNVTPIAPLWIRTNGVAFDNLNPSGGGGPFRYGLGLAENYDPKTYDHGRTEILGTGAQDFFVGGELWITYDLLLLKPRTSHGKSLSTYVQTLVEPPPNDTITVFPECPLSYQPLGSTYPPSSEFKETPDGT